MSTGILTTLLGVAATGVVSLIGAILFGKLVPVAHLTAVEQERDKWKQAYEEKRQAFDSLEKVVDRQQITAEVTNAVMNAVKYGIQIQGQNQSTQAQTSPPSQGLISGLGGEIS